MLKTTLLAAALLATTLQARAIEINFGTVLTDQDNEPIMDCAKSEPNPAGGTRCAKELLLTLGRAAFIALMTPTADEQNQTLDEKKRKGDIALTAYANGSADMTAEDIALIKKYIAKQYGPLVVVRAVPLLDRTKK